MQINIVDDVTAEKTLLELKEFTERKQRVIDVCNKMIAEYKEKIETAQFDIDDYTNQIKFALEGYLNMVKLKETPTQFSYELPSAKIVKKKVSKKLEETEDLINYVSDDYKEIQISVKWRELKKDLEIKTNDTGEHVIINNKTGEIVEGVIVKEEQGEIQIKF